MRAQRENGGGIRSIPIIDPPPPPFFANSTLRPLLGVVDSFYNELRCILCLYCTKLAPISKIGNVPRAKRVPPSGFEKAVKFCSGAR
ncbi:MAG: hypothetical protein A2665_00825 [Candidatus Zambryskibacteria bacterium RIFCSPHIGHO2_01_FULL_46_30]|uniref:Uncharacterized protein n=1 Tax=Candidatus Zambryskibacteria bacterium RIFCSPHIGHO2_01_FULL_46_30 TaxID=1802739 RepID=A0A1G2T381_9BACT|nr:MAG: hypothetical protein A2665_00825 [Candidatus Zambryskibacteria bacterium RIFCSPHIGHO2_01_FULL_46_30]